MTPIPHPEPENLMTETANYTAVAEAPDVKMAYLDQRRHDEFWAPYRPASHIHRNRYGAPRWYWRAVEAWWVLTGRWSLHRAWQNGLDEGSRNEYRRLITNKAYLAEVGS
jgi:hypothetical protein